MECRDRRRRSPRGWRGRYAQRIRVLALAVPLALAFAPPAAPALPHGASGASGASAAASAASADVPAPVRGRFVVAYAPPTTAEYRIYYDELQRERFLESVSGELNRIIDLPADVLLSLAECGHSTTTWQRDTRTVTVCYEFLDAVIAIAGQGAASVDRAEQLFSGAVTFALFAEVGQGLTSLFGLPVAGTPAQAGADFATIALAAAERDGDPTAGAAIEFLSLALGPGGAGFEWVETHAFDRAGLERVACLLYGNSPASHAAAIEAGVLGAARAPRCAEELVRVAKEWDSHLKSHTRPPETAAATGTP